MEGATHYIEVHKRSNGNIVYTQPLEIDVKSEQLEFTESLSNIKIICVWNIKLKDDLPK